MLLSGHYFTNILKSLSAKFCSSKSILLLNSDLVMRSVNARKCLWDTLQCVTEIVSSVISTDYDSGIFIFLEKPDKF